MEHTLFVWRDEVSSRRPEKCRFCNLGLAHVECDPNEYAQHRICKRCGWFYRHELWWDGGGKVAYDPEFVAVLKSFDVNDCNLELGELGTFIKRRNELVYELGWRRFEELICDVFKSRGWSVQLTVPSADGGADAIVFHRGTKLAIVECKRYARGRKIGVAVVRQLLGAAVDFGVRTAHLVTTSEFTKPAESYADRVLERGFKIDLHAASDVFQMLQVYNKVLPPIDQISLDDCRDWWPIDQPVRHTANKIR